MASKTGSSRRSGRLRDPAAAPSSGLSEVGHFGPRSQLFLQQQAAGAPPQLRRRAVRVVEIAEGNGLGGADLHARRHIVPLAQDPSFAGGLLLRPDEPVVAEGAFF